MRIKILGKCWELNFVATLGKDDKGRTIDGKCDPPDEKDKKIRILSRLRGQECLETLIHECLHAADWHKDEGWIEQVAHDIARATFRPGVIERIFENADTTETG